MNHASTALENPSEWAAIESIEGKMECTAETLRKWVGQAERDTGHPRLPDDRETLAERGEGRIFDVLGQLMSKAAQRGYKIRFNIGLFIKSQVTIGGILSELDPELDQDRYLMGRISRQVLKETPKRLAATLHPVVSRLEFSQLPHHAVHHEDVKDVQCQSWGRGLKAVGRGLWKGIRWPVEIFIR